MPHEDLDGEDRSVLSRPAASPHAQWSYGPGPEQVADVYLPADATGGPLVLVHGGFWRPEYDRAHLRPLASALAAAGHPVLSLEYRREPGRPEASVDDLHLALDTLATQPPPGWPSVGSTAVGHSAGGHLVLLLAASGHPSIDAVVALAPVADLRMGEEQALDEDAVTAFLGRSSTDRSRFDPAQRPPAVPVTVLHGARDSIVPIALTHSYAAGVDLVTVRELLDSGHFELIDPEADAFADLLSVLAAAGIE